MDLLSQPTRAKGGGGVASLHVQRFRLIETARLSSYMGIF